MLIMFQHRDVEEIKKALSNNFENICDWFVDNKLSIHFGKHNTKLIIFSSHCKIKKIRQFNIKYLDLEIKQ